jgi:hypothetical protein
LILDYNNSKLAMYEGGQRFLIFMFQTVNTRFGGIEYCLKLNIKKITQLFVSLKVMQQLILVNLLQQL